MFSRSVTNEAAIFLVAMATMTAIYLVIPTLFFHHQLLPTQTYSFSSVLTDAMTCCLNINVDNNCFLFFFIFSSFLTAPTIIFIN